MSELYCHFSFPLFPDKKVVEQRKQIFTDEQALAADMPLPDDDYDF